jgi:hypothetical protein
MGIFRLLAVLALNAALLVACSSQQTGNRFGAVPTVSANRESAASTTELKPCTGTHGVAAHPCPRKLKTDNIVLVHVTGPSLAYIEFARCNFFDYYLCEVDQRSHAISVWPAKNHCGTGHFIITVYDRHKRLVGEFREKVIDKTCQDRKTY